MSASRKKFKVWIFALKVLLGMALLVVIFRKFSMSVVDVLDIVNDWRAIYLASLIPILIMPVLSINRWKLFLFRVGIHERFLTLWCINLISMFQGLILPSTQGVDVFRVYHIGKRHAGYVGEAAGAVLIERMVGLLIWCGIALGGLPLVLSYERARMSIAITVVGFSMVATIATALVVSPRIHALYSGLCPKSRILVKIVSVLDKTHAMLVAFPYREVLFSSVCLIALYQICSIVCIWLVFWACGVHLPFSVHMAFYPVISIIAMMPVTVGGIGIREGAFAYFYSLVGVSAETAVSVSVINYAILILLPSLLGGLIWAVSTFCAGSFFVKREECNR